MLGEHFVQARRRSARTRVSSRGRLPMRARPFAIWREKQNRGSRSSCRSRNTSDPLPSQSSGVTARRASRSCDLPTARCADGSGRVRSRCRGRDDQMPLSANRADCRRDGDQLDRARRCGASRISCDACGPQNSAALMRRGVAEPPACRRRPARPTATMPMITSLPETFMTRRFVVHRVMVAAFWARGAVQYTGDRE